MAAENMMNAHLPLIAGRGPVHASEFPPSSGKSVGKASGSVEGCPAFPYRVLVSAVNAGAITKQGPSQVCTLHPVDHRGVIASARQFATRKLK
jgi:hypothetical protein